MRRFRRPPRTVIATVAVLAGLLLAATPASAAPGDWWQFGYTAAHTRANPNETTINQQNVATLGIAAQQRPRLEIDLGAGHDAADAGALAVANGLAYANAWNYEGGTSALLAYDTGSFQAPASWRQERVGCAGRSPAVHLGIVFVGSFPCRPSAANGALRAFDGASGRLLWSYTANEEVGTVSATGGVVYASASDSLYQTSYDLLALDARSGAVIWHVKPGQHTGDPAVAGGRVFVGTAGGRLQARSAATGALLWSRPGAGLLGSPAVTGGVVYSLGTENGASRLFARRAGTGALVWKRPLPGQLTGAWPAVAGGRVLASTSAGISAFDAASGASRWRATVAGASSPAVANGLVFAGLASGVGAWRLSDGVRRWTYGTIAYGDPTVSGGRLYVAAFTAAGDQPFVLLDQFALGAAAPGVIS